MDYVTRDVCLDGKEITVNIVRSRLRTFSTFVFKLIGFFSYFKELGPLTAKLALSICLKMKMAELV